MENFSCKNNRTTFAKILEKINEIIAENNRLNGCCEYLHTFDDVNFVLVGDKLFATNDGSTPVAVPLPVPEPDTMTRMNHVEMYTIKFNYNRVKHMFMNGVLVFAEKLLLELPQYDTTFSLAKFISDHNPLGIKRVIVINRKTQPTMKSGDLSYYDSVIFANHGQIQGTTNSSDGMIITSGFKLVNDGWIKGAGGIGSWGKPGQKGANSSKKVSGSETRGASYANNCYCWRPKCNRGAGLTQVAWSGRYIHVGGNRSGPYTVGGVGGLYRGAAAGTRTEAGSVEAACAGYTSYLYKIVRRYSYTTYFTGGDGGTPGRPGEGMHFGNTNTSGGAGGHGWPSTPAGGNSGSAGTNGTNGGYWGQAGTSGAAGGHAITGSSLLDPGSTIGRVEGYVS